MDSSISEAATSTPPEPTTRPPAGRTWTHNLWLHALLLGCVLVAFLPVIGVHAVYSGDEGAALSQAKQLRDHGTWFIPNPMPQVDPDGQAAAITRSTLSRNGYAPLLKHPAYIYLLVGSEAIAGSSGPFLLGILGTVLAAIAAAMITRERTEWLTIWALWLTGLATPLLFDSYMVIAHTIAAAGTGFAAVGLVRFRRSHRPADLALAAIGIGFAVVLRSEALLFGLALGVVAGMVALRGRLRPLRETVRRCAAAAALVGSTVVAFLGDRLVTTHLATQLLNHQGPAPMSVGFVAGRISAFTGTWLLPGYAAGVWPQVPAMLTVVTIVTVVLARRARVDIGLMRAGVVCMCLIGATWVVFNRISVVPGVLAAFPLLAAGLAGWKRSLLRNMTVVLLAGTTVIFAAAVLVTEYPSGGSVEWGARYLAIAIPISIPLILWSLDNLRGRLPAVGRRWMTIGLVPLVVAPAVGSIVTLRYIHQKTRAVVGSVAHAAAQTTPGDGGKPVVVTGQLQFPRLAWDRVDSGRWFAASGDNLVNVERRLADNGIKQFLYITVGSDRNVGSRYVARNCRPSDLGGSAWVVCDADLR